MLKDISGSVKVKNFQFGKTSLNKPKSGFGGGGAAASSQPASSSTEEKQEGQEG